MKKNCKIIIIVNQTTTFGKIIYCKKSSLLKEGWGKMLKMDKFIGSFSIAVAGSSVISYLLFGEISFDLSISAK